MIEATPDITAQLVRIKHTFQIASTFAAKPDPASRVVATILMDYVAESALKTVYWAHPATAPTARETTFPELVRAVAALTGTPPTLPLQSEIGNLHRQRNDTQHRNLVPSTEDVPRHVAYVEAFLRDLFTRFFAVDFDALALASLVSDPELRAQLETAETHLVAGRRREAVEEAAKALHQATWIAGDLAGAWRQERWTDEFSISGPPGPPGWIPRRLADVGRQEPPTLTSILATPHGWDEFSPAQQEAISQIVEWIQSLTQQFAETLRALAVGGDWGAYMRFRAIAPHVSFGVGPTGGLGTNVAHRTEGYSEDDARAVFHYALDQILRLQAMGALPAPREEQ